MRTWRRVGTGLVLAGLLAACAPAAVPGEGAPAAPVTTTAAPFPGPPRPRAVEVGGVPPCELLTEAQRAELGLDGEPQRDVSRTALFGEARACSIIQLDAEPAVAVNITLSDTYGLERFYDPGVDPPVEPIVVAGYAAVLSRPDPARPSSCAVAIDIAPGQMVGVLVSDGGDVPPVPLEELCRAAPRVAAEVMETLLAR